jgi:protein ImuB
VFCALAAPIVAPASRITEVLAEVGRGSSPRVELTGPGVVVIDARGLGRLFGDPVRVAALCRQQAAERGVDATVAIASTRTAALLLALAGARPAGTVTVAPGGEAAALAPLPVSLVARLAALDPPARPGARTASRGTASGPAEVPLDTWRRWGIGTLGALAALPAADLFERMGAAGLAWQAIARGEDARPLVPTAESRPFEATCAFEWPIEAIEPLAFALGRVIDPLCLRLDRGGLATVTLQTTLRLVTRELYVRRLGLPMPMRDPRVLRTLIVLDLESHPPPAGIDAVTVTLEPVAGRILQPSLFARAYPRPETIATLTARLQAVMGEGRVGSPVAVDTHRGGAFAMRPAVFSPPTVRDAVPDEIPDRWQEQHDRPDAGKPVLPIVLRRFRQPPRVRVDVARGRPVRVRPLEPGRLPRLGAIRQAAGPWRTSGDWWRVETPAPWDDDEWDVVLESGCALRLARDRRDDAWVVVALID